MKRMEISLELNAPMMRERPPMGECLFLFGGFFSALVRPHICSLHFAKTPQTGRLTDVTSCPGRALTEETIWD
jgi:hypothetical protein